MAANQHCDRRSCGPRATGVRRPRRGKRDGIRRVALGASLTRFPEARSEGVYQLQAPDSYLGRCGLELQTSLVSGLSCDSYASIEAVARPPILPVQGEYSNRQLGQSHFNPGRRLGLHRWPEIGVVLTPTVDGAAMPRRLARSDWDGCGAQL